MFQITIGHRAFGGDVAVVLGQGDFIDGALKDAAGLIAMPFRPKQDGRQPQLLNITMRRPDGTQYSATKDELKAKLAQP